MSVSIAAAVYFMFGQNALAMHIMEGYLPAGYCIFWGALCIPFLVYGFIKIRRIVSENRRSITLLAMAGAFIFVISSLKIPSVTGSCSHMTGTGLGAILFGAFPVSNRACLRQSGRRRPRTFPEGAPDSARAAVP